MPAVNQDFEIFSGKNAQPVFTVMNAAGTAPLDISTVTNITWTCQASLSASAALTKTKIAGGIAFVTSGADGKFKVIFAPGDTAALAQGFYFYEADIVEAGGAITPVATGRVRIGPAPVWTYSGDPSSSTKDAVRYLMGDVVYTDQQATDAEILYAVAQGGNAYSAASVACRALAAKLSREADTVDKDLRDSISQRAMAYARMANTYEEKGMAVGGAMPWAGGISKAQKQSQQDNTDRVEPQFTIGMDDNLNAPVYPVDGETLN